MQDLLSTLVEAGWRLLDSRESDSASADPFALENDVVRWVISRDDGEAKLTFHAFGRLGQRTVDLRDILFCIIEGTDERLYFDKRETMEWRVGVADFVRHVAASAQRRAASLKSSS